jgi:hypothetical protein
MLQIIFHVTGALGSFETLSVNSKLMRMYSFFTHLVDVLGSEDFLPPICMLLIEKAANRVVRQTSEEVQNSLALPLSILHHNTSALQIGVCPFVSLHYFDLYNWSFRRVSPKYYVNVNGLRH